MRSHAVAVGRGRPAITNGQTARTRRHDVLALQSAAGNHAVATFVQRARRGSSTQELDDGPDSPALDVDEDGEVDADLAAEYAAPAPVTLGAFLDPALDPIRDAETRRLEAAALESTTQPRGRPQWQARAGPVDPNSHFTAQVEARTARDEATTNYGEARRTALQPPVAPAPVAPAPVAAPAELAPAPVVAPPEAVPPVAAPAVADPEATRRAAIELTVRNGIAARVPTKWAQLSPDEQTVVMTDAMTTAVPTAQKLRGVAKAATKRGDKNREAKAAQKVEEFKVRAVQDAIDAAVPRVETLAAQATVRANQAKLESDKNFLTLYIESLPVTVAIKSILVKAVALLNLSNAAFGEMISGAQTASDIAAAAVRWVGMQDHVTDQRKEVPNAEGAMIDNPRLGEAVALKIVTNMHVPGGATTKLDWKDRGSNWEKTKNLVCMVDTTKNNIHVHTTGGWQKPKNKFPIRPT